MRVILETWSYVLFCRTMFFRTGKSSPLERSSRPRRMGLSLVLLLAGLGLEAGADDGELADDSLLARAARVAREARDDARPVGSGEF